MYCFISSLVRVGIERSRLLVRRSWAACNREWQNLIERQRTQELRLAKLLVWRGGLEKSPILKVFALTLMVCIVYFVMKLAPVQASAYQFDDAVRDEVLLAGGRRSSDDAIKGSLVERAVILGLPVQRSDIKITRPNSSYIIVEVNYEVALEFIGGYTYQSNFSPKHRGRLTF